ncbi:hypothetical protein BS50DRAFT_497536 [Corynespora cassiicola Philippines]|uniref:Fork-head domain-containing protein n=1 Tax=Corynespora cassiicola Philippines TaxID=1448308 RepID=A0A2T2NI62_CORCC|nr:hypothetical protein BS50DRAFT_497536 [Corynespora cassiicola Philippines]
MGQNGPAYHIALQYAPSPPSLYDCAQNGMPYSDNYHLSYSSQYSGTSCPRSYSSGLGLTGLPNGMAMQDSYPPAAYQIDPPVPPESAELSDQAINGQLMQLSDDYDRKYQPDIKVEDQHASFASPYDSDVSRCSTPHDGLFLPSHGLKSECVGDDGGIDKEQPYAQLIYRALMEQPNKTMILRDIYDWFKRNTDKAADKETKGWQNSIRHNLSMNGAFEKVDQPGEEPKKGFMWRLTEEAIREGVKSTTRYRSKQPNKRGQRSHNPQPQRQASGAKGGQAARRSAKLRRSNRINEAYRSEPFSRSVPAEFGPIFNTEATMPYPPSPYYGSEGDFIYSPSFDDFGGTLINAPLDMFSMPSCIGADATYVLPQEPTDLMVSNSPSPSASEPQPRTPESPHFWDDGMPTDAPPYVLDDTCLQGYMG